MTIYLCLFAEYVAIYFVNVLLSHWCVLLNKHTDAVGLLQAQQLLRQRVSLLIDSNIGVRIMIVLLLSQPPLQNGYLDRQDFSKRTKLVTPIYNFLGNNYQTLLPSVKVLFIYYYIYILWN